jgi:hypothetical protein
VQVEKAPLESYADVGGLESQVQEIKEAVELPLIHPELYEDIGIKPPKVTPGILDVGWVQTVTGHDPTPGKWWSERHVPHTHKHTHTHTERERERERERDAHTHAHAHVGMGADACTYY